MQIYDLISYCKKYLKYLHLLIIDNTFDLFDYELTPSHTFDILFYSP